MTTHTSVVVSDVDMRAALHAAMRDIFQWAREIKMLPPQQDVRLALIANLVSLRDHIQQFDQWHFGLAGGAVAISWQDGEWEISPPPEPHTIARTLTLLFDALHRLHSWRHDVDESDSDAYICRFLHRISAREIDMRWPDTDRDDYFSALLAVGQASCH